MIFTQKFFACYAKNENIRKCSSSGGIFYLLAEIILESGGIVVGAGYDEYFTVKHFFIEDKKEMFNILGSKYVSSELGETFGHIKEYLNENRKILFCGTPCQVAGLKSYLGKEYGNLLAIDFICHGVPSPMVWKEYLTEISQAKIPIAINFRDKTTGWNNYSLKINFSNKSIYSMPRHQDLYMQAFLKDITLRPSCYNCKFKKLMKHSDITLGDMWCADRVLPDMFDDRGLSMIWINTEKGNSIFEEIKHRINYKMIDSSFVTKYNPNALRSVKRPLERKVFYMRFNKGYNIMDNMKYTTEGLPHTRIKRMIKKIIKKK